MILQKYGVQLDSLQYKDIQMVRSWRNAEFVQKNMLFDKKLTPKMQEDWFARLNESDIYLMIIHQSIQIGIIHVKNIDWKKRKGEAGIFIGNLNYHKSYIPMLAIACLMDSFFYDFSFTELTAKVKKGNKTALDFNYFFGYELVAKGNNFHSLLVSKDLYSKSKMKLSKILKPFEVGNLILDLSSEEKNHLLLRK